MTFKEELEKLGVDIDELMNMEPAPEPELSPEQEEKVEEIARDLARGLYESLKMADDVIGLFSAMNDSKKSDDS